MINDIDWTDVVAFLGTLSTFVLGFVGYRRSKKADKTAEKAGAVEQIINGLNLLVDQLQEDNQEQRVIIKELADALQTTTEERDRLKAEVTALKRQYVTAT